MVRMTDCESPLPVESWSRMLDFDDLEARIDALCARATSERPSARLLVEIEDLLAEGYICALRGDHLSRHLQDRLDALLHAAGSGDELRALAHEQRAVSEGTRELRTRLAVMRERWMSLGSQRIGLA